MKKSIVRKSLVALTLMLVSCGAVVAEPTSVDGTDSTGFSISRVLHFQRDNGGVFVMVDPETGVNYLILLPAPRTSSDFSVAITPRLNADGSLFVSE